MEVKITKRVHLSVQAMRHLRTTRWTLRLVTEESMKLSTKLRHVDIHNHWLRQEYAERRVLFEWTPTRDMIADGLVGFGNRLTSLTSENLYWKPRYLHVCPTPIYQRISCISQYWVVGSSFQGLRASPVRTPIYICMIAPISVL